MVLFSNSLIIMDIIIILTFATVEFCSLGLYSDFPVESLPTPSANEYLMHGTPLNKSGGRLEKAMPAARQAGGIRSTI